MGAATDIILVEHSFSEPAEEARHAVLQHLAARRQQRRSRRNGAAQRQQVAFVTAGAVQQEQRRCFAPSTRLEAMDEAEMRLHIFYCFTIERYHQMEHAVGRRMLGTDIQEHKISILALLLHAPFFGFKPKRFLFAILFFVP